jgi:hypothetical protein
MPTADGKPTAEDIVALMQTKPNMAVFLQNLELVTGGLADLVNRVRNLEYGSLAAAEGNRIALTGSDDHEKRLVSLEGDRKTDRSRLDTIEAAPAGDTKRVDDLEKRVRTVEGAVGSTAFAAAKATPAAPATPFKGPDATAPVAVSKSDAPAAPTTILGGPADTKQ